MKSVSNHSFSLIPRAEIPRSVFDRSHNRKMSMDADYLVPIYCDEVLPGDSFKLDTTHFARLTSPLTTPVMDNLYLDMFWFFVPNRLVWNNWQKMCGEQENPGDSTDFLVPQIKFDSTHPVEVGSIYDAFGLPLFHGTQATTAPTQRGEMRVNSLPFRAYNLIYNEWFRDQNLIDSVKVLKDDIEWNNGYEDPEGTATSDQWKGYELLKRAKRHDYFTSSLPWPQKGPGVELPLGGLAPVSLYNLTGTTASVDNLTDKALDFINAPSVQTAAWYGFNDGDSAAQMVRSNQAGAWDAAENKIIAADLSAATAATINSLRQAFQLQRLYERDARGGTRYTEILRSHFGVVSPDARLQRPEYLGGSSQMFVVNPISQTSATTEVTPQGNLVAIGMSGGNNRGFRKSFVEHGFIIGLAQVRSDITYQQGLNRMWSRRSRFDYYWPALAHLGEQAILNKEIFVQGDGVKEGDNVVDEQVFGYQERWAEYRYKPNEIIGVMRSNAQLSLDIWHLAQYFTELPKLNEHFINSSTPLDRVTAVPDEPNVLLDINFNVKVARPMPVYSVPGLIDHF